MYSVKEVAKRLGVSAQCVYALVQRGTLACHRIGLGRGTIRISDSDLNDFLNSSRESSVLVTDKIPKKRFPKLKHIFVQANSAKRNGNHKNE